MLYLPGEISDYIGLDENSLWTQRQLKRAPFTLAGEDVLTAQVAGMSAELNAFYQPVLPKDPGMRLTAPLLLEIIKNAHTYGTTDEDPYFTMALWGGRNGWAVGTSDANGFWGRQDVKERLEAGEPVGGLPGIPRFGEPRRIKGRNHKGYGICYLLSADRRVIDTEQQAGFFATNLENTYGEYLHSASKSVQNGQ